MAAFAFCLIPFQIPAATDSSATLFPLVDVSLTNGLRLLISEDHQCPIVSVQVWYHVGSANESANRHGFAHLFEHMMFRGTDRLGPADHNNLIESVGGRCNAFTSFDETCYEQTLPSKQLELALWLESERMAFLTVDAAGLNAERKVVEEERRMNLNRPYGDVADLGLPAVFETHPYASSPIGNIRDLRQSTVAEVHAWWRSWYVPNNATIVITGDVRPDEARKLVERYFQWIPRLPLPARNIPAVPAFDSARTLVLKLANAPAPAVGLLWRSAPEGTPDKLALELLAQILGGGESSRLYRRLVAEKRLAVDARAVTMGLEKAGLFGAGAAVSPLGGDLGAALTVLTNEIEILRSNGVTADELDKARNQALSEMAFEAQTADGKARMIGRAAVVGTGTDELRARLQQLHQLTRDDLERAARLYLDPGHAMTVTIPGSKWLDQLSRLFSGRTTPEEDSPVVVSSDKLLRGRPGIERPTALPVRPPIQDGNSPIPNLEIFEHHFTNGLRLLVVPNLKTPALELVLALPRGAWAEQKSGAAAMTLNMVSKATETRDEKSLAEELDRYAIQLSGTATADDSRIRLTCLSEHSERAFALLADVTRHPIFPETGLKTAILQAQTDLTISDNTPAAVADREFRRQLFPRHPYGRRVSGETSDLAALRREDLVSSWNQIGDPKGATLIVAGALSREEALALADRFFANWSRRAPELSATSIPEPPPPATANNTRIILVDWPGAAQSEIRIGAACRVIAPGEKPIADLVSSYFGGSFASRLMKSIRIEHGGTYGVNGGIYASRFAGRFQVSTFTKTESTPDTLKTILSEIRGLIDRAPSEAEMLLHRRYFLGSAAGRFETAGQVAAQLARISLNGLPLDYVQQTFSIIEKAESSRCRELASQIVDPDHLLIVVVGEASKLSDRLRAIAPVTILDRNGKPVP